MEIPEMTDGLVGLLGLTFDEASGDRVVIRWKVRPELHQPAGILHGGVYCAVVETVGSVGGTLWLGDRGSVVGVSNQTDFLRAVREGELVAVGTPVHRGRSQQLWQVEITDAGGRLVSRGQVRLQNLSRN
ncbi:thioesterase [Micromonospora wenchangensis]|uniref:Thioesterase n=2 Tax=Micromonospora wenchangensis TaxID=1185415 RepID=A0A246RJD2_9ACTN|nr:thioesterase [Micromonospora wenchangensis]